MAAVDALSAGIGKPIHTGTTAINSQQPSKSEVILSPLIMVNLLIAARNSQGFINALPFKCVILSEVEGRPCPNPPGSMFLLP